MKLRNDGGLWFDEDKGTLLGYLVDFQGHGIFSPDGRVTLTKEEGETHNKILDKIMIEGLDQNCKVGQCGTFYFIGGKVTTFMGTLIAGPKDIIVKGKSIVFVRLGKRFRGILQKNASCFNFKRIS